MTSTEITIEQLNDLRRHIALQAGIIQGQEARIKSLQGDVRRARVILATVKAKLEERGNPFYAVQARNTKKGLRSNHHEKHPVYAHDWYNVSPQSEGVDSKNVAELSEWVANHTNDEQELRLIAYFPPCIINISDREEGE